MNKDRIVHDTYVELIMDNSELFGLFPKTHY